MKFKIIFLQKLIKACKNQKRSSQQELYKMYYSYALNICVHYARDLSEAKDMAHEGFLNVFKRIDNYKEHTPFELWLRRVMINAAIDYHRKYHKNVINLEVVQKIESTSNVFDDLGFDELLKMIQQLTPRYRLVFNLYIMEGFSHKEIAERLEISVGTSKSNLARAKIKLQGMVSKTKKIEELTKIK